MNSRNLRLIPAVCLMSLSAAASADNICIAVEGTITSIFEYDSGIDSVVKVGDTFTGEYTYSTDIVDNNSIPNVGDYWHTSPPNGFTLTAGGLTIYTDPAYTQFLLEMVNDFYGQDNYLIRSYKNVVEGIPQPDDTHLAIQLDDPTQAAISNADIPLTPPDLNIWQQPFGLDISGRNYYTYGEFYIRGKLTSAEFCSVDEDNDGVEDEDDLCPASNLAATLVIGGNDTGVANTVDAEGCSLADKVSNVAASSKNKGAFVSGVAGLTNDLVAQGIISGKQKGKIQSAAAKAK